MSTEWGGFKLGDKTALQLNIIMRDGPGVPILPTTRDRVSTIPGKNGVFYFGADLQEMRFSIPCAFIFANNRETLAQHADDLAAHLVDDTTKQPKKLTLIFEDNKDKEWEVYYSGFLDLARTVLDGEFDLPLMAPDPFDFALVEPPEPPEPDIISPDFAPEESLTFGATISGIVWQGPPVGPQVFQSQPAELATVSFSLPDLGGVSWARFEIAEPGEIAQVAAGVQAITWDENPLLFAGETVTLSGEVKAISWEERSFELSEPAEIVTVAAGIDDIDWELFEQGIVEANESASTTPTVENIEWLGLTINEEDGDEEASISPTVENIEWEDVS